MSARVLTGVAGNDEAVGADEFSEDILQDDLSDDMEADEEEVASAAEDEQQQEEEDDTPQQHQEPVSQEGADSVSEEEEEEGDAMQVEPTPPPAAGKKRRADAAPAGKKKAGAPKKAPAKAAAAPPKRATASKTLPPSAAGTAPKKGASKRLTVQPAGAKKRPVTPAAAKKAPTAALKTKKTKKATVAVVVDDDTMGKKPRRWRSGTVALREIRRYQQKADHILKKAPFRRLIRKTVDEHNTPSTTYTLADGFTDSVMTATEDRTDRWLQAGVAIMLEAGRVTLEPSDLRLAELIYAIYTGSNPRRHDKSNTADIDAA